MSANWVMTAKIDQYEAEISYREDFGVWDCSLYDHNKNEYLRQETLVGGFEWFMKEVDDWFDSYSLTKKFVENPITNDAERDILKTNWWYLSDSSDKDVEVWVHGDNDEIRIERYHGVTYVSGNPFTVNVALKILSRFYQDYDND